MVVVFFPFFLKSVSDTIENGHIYIKRRFFIQPGVSRFEPACLKRSSDFSQHSQASRTFTFVYIRFSVQPLALLLRENCSHAKALPATPKFCCQRSEPFPKRFVRLLNRDTFRWFYIEKINYEFIKSLFFIYCQSVFSCDLSQESNRKNSKSSQVQKNQAAGLGANRWCDIY